MGDHNNVPERPEPLWVKVIGSIVVGVVLGLLLAGWLP